MPFDIKIFKKETAQEITTLANLQLSRSQGLRMKNSLDK